MLFYIFTYTLKVFVNFPVPITQNGDAKALQIGIALGIVLTFEML